MNISRSKHKFLLSVTKQLHIPILDGREVDRYWDVD